MKYKITFATLFALIVSLTASSAFSMNYVAGKYQIDPAHTFVTFAVPHFVISEVEGRFNDVSGSFTAAEPFTNSSADVTVNTASIDTGVKKRDEDLRSKNFFEVSKYPKMTFKTTSITGTMDSFKATGMLTIKDVTKEITLNGKFGGTITDPWGNRRASLKLDGKINRRDFHINYSQDSELGPGIGDEITIRINTDGIIPKKN
jgi:polyisoprenoid-binding protein YceI